MKKSLLEPEKELRNRLLAITGIVELCEHNNYESVSVVLDWLKNTENFFEKYNYVQCAEIAGYRASILAGQITISEKRSLQKKYVRKKAIETIQPVQQILSHKYEEINSKLENVRSLIKQILVPAKEMGLISYQKNIDLNSYIESLMLELKKNKQVAPLLNSAIITVGKYDVIRIIADELEFS
ncbi:MAG: hypothetical protein R6U95_08885 [Bacteroidales bacterium]